MPPKLEPTTYDELYVVSDLHLGGAPERRIFDQPRELASLVELVAERPPGVRAALVLNGDTIDFRALDPPEHFAERGGPDKLARVLGDPYLDPVITALRRLVHSRDRRLVVIPGNHDAELALPAVEKVLRDALCEGDRRASRRLIVEGAEGDGRHVAYVGPARVVCVHGDEVDPWERVDRAQLRSRVEAQDAALPPWQPSPGCEFYVDLLGPIFHAYPWLRIAEESPHLGPLVLALAPALRGPALLSTVRLALRAYARSKRPVERLPAPQRFPARGSAMVHLASSDGRPDTRAARGDPHSSSPVLSALLAMLFPGRLRNLMRVALRPAHDRAHDLAYVDAHEAALEEIVGPDIDFLLTGHTHQPRAHYRAGGHGVYFNTGSWAKVLAPGPEVLDQPDAFEPLYQALLARSLPTLDEVPGAVIRREPLVAVVRAEGSVVTGQLRLARAGAAPAPLRASTFVSAPAGVAAVAG